MPQRNQVYLRIIGEFLADRTVIQVYIALSYLMQNSHKLQKQTSFRAFEKAFPIGVFTFIILIDTLLTTNIYCFHR